MSIEHLQWHDATLRKPDDTITVLCWISCALISPDADPAEGDIEAGYWESLTGMWVSCVTGGELPGVTHWAVPQGPRS